MSKPDDTQELDEILCQAFYIEDGEYIGSYKEGSPIGLDIKQSLLDWHNKQVKNAVATAEDDLDQYWNKELDKQIEVVLDRIESGSFGIKQDIGVSQYPARSVYEPEHIAAIHKVVPLSAIEAERDRLNPSKSTPFNKLKEAEL